MEEKDTREEYREELREAARAYRWPMRVFLSLLIAAIVAMCLFVTFYNVGLVATSSIGFGAALPRLLGCLFGLLVSAVFVFWIRDLWLAEAILGRRAKPLFEERSKEPIQQPEPMAPKGRHGSS